jgi:hypothetical protein
MEIKDLSINANIFSFNDLVSAVSNKKIREVTLELTVDGRGDVFVTIAATITKDEEAAALPGFSFIKTEKSSD